MSKTIRIAQVMGKMESGGVESVVMNYYRHIDKSKIQFDFIVDNDSSVPQKEEIEELGGRIIFVPPYQHIFSYLKTLKKIFRQNKYKIVHSHLNTLNVFPLYAAKCANVPIRISHNHSTAGKGELFRNIMKYMLRPFSKIYPTHYFACTNHAGKWLFGNNTFKEGKVKILNNAIDIDKFKFNEEVRDKIRKELGIENKLVLGHVGRFMKQKNHEFLIDLFYEIQKQEENAVLLLIGEGELEEEIITKVKELNIFDKVKFLGVRNDVYNLYSAMDIFLFPSLYEGLGMVLIEAQVSGLKCVASTNVPKEAEISNLVSFIPLESSVKSWVNEVLKTNDKKRISHVKEAKDRGYDIKEEAKILEKEYFNLIK